MAAIYRDVGVIRFSCHCGYLFELDQDQAGGTVQCPRCALLRDVPSYADLGRLAEDGTYQIEGAGGPEQENPENVQELAYVYRRGPLDLYGNEKDLRNTQADIDAIGGEPIPLVQETAPRDQAPRYDPETGELIAPLEVKPDGREHVNPAAIPMATPTINYASGALARKASIFSALAPLLWPVNLMVMFAVLCMHALLWPFFIVPVPGIFFMVTGLPVLGALLLAHYGNVVEDTGVWDRDELSRPLRELSFYDDIWSPFCNMFASLVVCYLPALILPMVAVRVPAARTAAVPLLMFLVAVGTFLLPAVMMTLQCGGTLLNLRPDRLLTVINLCGLGYFLAVVGWVVAAGVYLWGWLGTCLAASRLFFSPPPMLSSWMIVLPLLLAGIFLMHLFCRWLGLLYRAHGHDFPWVLQRHIPTN